MTTTPPILRHSPEPFRWDATPVLDYKEAGVAPFKSITRQTLFIDPGLACELRYLEIAPGGYSTLEQHEHQHAVMILRGRGQCLVGNAIADVQPHDLVAIPPLTWHQFRAMSDDHLGFLCMVNAERDRPRLPDAQTLRDLRADPAIAAFLDGGG